MQSIYENVICDGLALGFFLNLSVKFPQGSCFKVHKTFYKKNSERNAIFKRIFQRYC